MKLPLISRDILRRNGSVVDAGVAAQLCNGVVDQIHMGLGGGAVSLVYERLVWETEVVTRYQYSLLIHYFC